MDATAKGWVHFGLKSIAVIIVVAGLGCAKNSQVAEGDKIASSRPNGAMPLAIVRSAVHWSGGPNIDLKAESMVPGGEYVVMVVWGWAPAQLDEADEDARIWTMHSLGKVVVGPPASREHGESAEPHPPRRDDAHWLSARWTHAWPFRLAGSRNGGLVEMMRVHVQEGDEYCFRSGFEPDDQSPYVSNYVDTARLVPQFALFIPAPERKAGEGENMQLKSWSLSTEKVPRTTGGASRPTPSDPKPISNE